MNDTTFHGNGKVVNVPVIFGAKPKPITNADRIRGMSDEELLKFIEMIHYNGRLGLSPYYGWDEWLKKEAEEETCTEKL